MRHKRFRQLFKINYMNNYFKLDAISDVVLEYGHVTDHVLFTVVCLVH